MSGNGVDLGHIAAMLQQVIAAQAEQASLLGSRIDRLDRAVADVIIDVRGLASDPHNLTSKVGGVVADIAGLRQAVADYHGSVMGQVLC